MTTVADAAYLTTSEVARLFGVHPKTVVRWATSGRLPFTQTLGGHRRFDRADMVTLLGPQADDRRTATIGGMPQG